MSARPASAGSGASVTPHEVRLLVPPRLRAAHDLVCIRAREVGAEALLLTGSTARGARTSISDLDYHVIGVAIPHDDLPADLDIHVVSSDLIHTRLEEGDDFTHWSLRFGQIVFDNGIVNDSLRLDEQRGLWPDVSRKADQSIKSLKIAMAMVQSGDREAAVEQVRTALTLAARWQLLAAHRFPLSRAELPAQLNEVGLSHLAVGLDATIAGNPQLEELAEFLGVVQRLVDTTAVANEPTVSSHAA